MALRKYYDIALPQSLAQANIIPFVNGIDNGEVRISQGCFTIDLTYEDIALLYHTIYPQQTHDCEGNEVESYATLNQGEREHMYNTFPETRPQPIGPLEGVPEYGR